MCTGAVAGGGVKLVARSTAALEVTHHVLTLSVDTKVVEHVTFINIYTDASLAVRLNHG